MAMARRLPSVRVLLVVGVCCTLTICHAAVIPVSSAADKAVMDSSASPSAPASTGAPRTFLGSTGSPAAAAPGAVAEPGRAGLLQRGPQHALVDHDQVAGAAHVVDQRPLDSAPALLRDAQRDGVLGLRGAVVPSDNPVGVAAVKPSAAEAMNSDGPNRSQSKESYISSIVSVLQNLIGQKPEPATQMPGLGQVHVMKKPVFSDSFLPPLVQVLTHLVDEVEDRDHGAQVTTTTGTTDMETVTAATGMTEGMTEGVTESVTEGVTESVTEGMADATEVVPVLGGTPVVVPSSSVGPVAILPINNTNPADGGTQVVQIVSDGKPVTDEGSPVLVAIPNGQSAVVVPIVPGASTSSVVPTSTPAPAAHDAQEPTVTTSSPAQATPAVRSEDSVKEIETDDDKDADKDADKDIDDEDMMEDMPVVQEDVPIVNEEMVPMMMMTSMVPSDLPEMVMDMVMDMADDTEDAEVIEPTTSVPSAARRSKRDATVVFPSEFKTFSYYPVSREPDEDDDARAAADDEEAEDALDLKDDVLDGLRGEAAWTKVPKHAASPALLKLIKLRFALSAEAKRQKFKNVQGFSDKVLAELVKTSTLTGREQLGTLLRTVLERDEIKSQKTRTRALKALAALESEDSDISKVLEGIPALKYSP